MRVLYHLFVGAILLFCVESYAATIHAILVGDVEDPTIGKAVRNDIACMHQRVQDIARFTDMSLSETILIERDYSCDKVITELKRLRIAPDDVIIYYHSSHGFRTPCMSEPWPALCFGANDRPERLQYFIDLIRSKRPAFSLIMVDACNTLVNFDWPGYPNGAFYSGSPSDAEQKKGYRRLFKESRGCFIASSSMPGQSSYSINGVGAIFTGSFLQALDHTLITGQADWNKVAAATNYYSKRLVTRFGLEQTPKFQID